MLSQIAAVASIPSFILAQATNDGNPLGIIFTGSAATVVVTVMAWIVRKVVSGEVVPIPIKELLESQKISNANQERILERLLEERNENKAMIRASTEAQFAIHEYLRAHGAVSGREGIRPGTAPGKPAV